MTLTEFEALITSNLEYIDQAISDATASSSFCRMLGAQIQETDAKLKAADESLQLCADGMQLFHLMSDQIQNQVIKVESICTNALQAVLMNLDLSFKIKSEKRKNAVDTHFFIVDKNTGELDIVKSEAGGTKNIIAVCLHLVFSELCNPKVEGPVVLDEAGSNISAEYQANFGKFLKNFSRSTGRQIILVSHQAPVITEAETVVALTRIGTMSKVKEPA